MLAQGPRWRGFASQGDGVGGGGPDGRERSPQRAGYVSPREHPAPRDRRTLSARTGREPRIRVRATP